MKIKKCVWIPIVCILSISLLAFVGYHGLRLYASYRFYKLMTREETYHNTYDGRYGYLQLSSEQGLSCVINIYEHSEMCIRDRLDCIWRKLRACKSKRRRGGH